MRKLIFSLSLLLPTLILALPPKPGDEAPTPKQLCDEIMEGLALRRTPVPIENVRATLRRALDHILKVEDDGNSNSRNLAAVDLSLLSKTERQKFLNEAREMAEERLGSRLITISATKGESPAKAASAAIAQLEGKLVQMIRETEDAPLIEELKKDSLEAAGGVFRISKLLGMLVGHGTTYSEAYPLVIYFEDHRSLPHKEGIVENSQMEDPVLRLLRAGAKWDLFRDPNERCHEKTRVRFLFTSPSPRTDWRVEYSLFEFEPFNYGEQLAPTMTTGGFRLLDGMDFYLMPAIAERLKRN